jgi:hypothetical protein
MDTELRSAADAPDLSSPLFAANIERAARDFGWRVNERTDDETLSMRVSGEWSDYDLTLRTIGEHDSIEVSCVFALAPPRERWIEVAKLADSLNRSFHRGLLELRIKEDHGTYTDWVPMTASRNPKDLDLIEAMRGAVGTCDMLLFPAFHCVAWAEINAETALDRLNFGPASHRFH